MEEKIERYRHPERLEGFGVPLLNQAVLVVLEVLSKNGMGYSY
jgi:hypothetical protein